jgi:CubicO group peptidase (beta-lactamase class C family)
MNLKRTFIPLLAGGLVLALALRSSAKPAAVRAKPGDASYGAIDTYLEEQMRRLNLPGLSLAIVEGERIAHLRGFGHARPGDEAPGAQTPFVLGSITKSFTALAVMQLVERGQIELDAPIQRYLPWFRVADPAASAKITVRHLLNQTSGLPLVPGWETLADFDPSPDASERQARALASVKLSHPVGAVFEYSNSNYDLLGLIVTAVSGETYADYVQHHLFEPLEMRHSFTSQTEARQAGLAVGHPLWFGFPVATPDLPMPSASIASGQLIASAEDMGHYLIAHLNGGRYGEAQILSPAGVDALHTGAIDASAGGVRQQYAMGWYVARLGGTRVDSHTGMAPDFYTYMALLPEQKKGVVLLINANHFTGELTLTEIGTGVAALLAGQPTPPIQLGAVPWVLRGLLLIPVLQLVDVFVTLRSTGRRQDKARSGPAWRSAVSGWLATILNLLPAAAAVAVWGGGLRGFLLLFLPDLSWLALVCGGFGLMWTPVRIWLTHRARPASIDSPGPGVSGPSRGTRAGIQTRSEPRTV